MNWLWRVLGMGAIDAPRVGDSQRILPSDQLLRCMTCDTDQPMASVVMLRSYALRDGKLVSEVTGERVSCQLCGAVFSIGPHGKFRQHAQALPYSPQPTQAPRPQPNGAADESPEPSRLATLPRPLERPRV